MALQKEGYVNKARNMETAPPSEQPRDQHRGLGGGDASRRGTPHVKNGFSFGKIPNKKG